jgi:hypothetical protein
MLDLLGDFEGPGSKFALDTERMAKACVGEDFSSAWGNVLADWAATQVRVLLRDSKNIGKDWSYPFLKMTDASPETEVTIHIDPAHFKDGIGGIEVLVGVERFKDLPRSELEFMARTLEPFAGTKTQLGRIFVKLPVRVRDNTETHEVLFLVDLLSPMTFVTADTMKTLTGDAEVVASTCVWGCGGVGVSELQSCYVSRPFQ